MRILVGLGNPGKEYAETRHNVGFRVIETLAARHNIALTRERHLARYGRGQIDNTDCLLVEPQTFMNNSGEAVARLLLFYRCTPADLLVVYDDIALALGVLRFRRGGSDGGHKGMRSVIQLLETTEIPRLRLGIGSPPPEMNAVDYVLSPFGPEEQEAAEQMIQEAAEAVEFYLREGMEAAMNRYNR